MAERARVVFVGVALLFGCSSGASSSTGAAPGDSSKAAAAEPSGVPAGSASSALPAPATASSVASAAPAASGSASPPAARKACPGYRDLVDLGDVSNGCHVYAATSKEWLPQDVVARPCKGGFAAAPGCVELVPDGCEAKMISFDGNAFGGPVIVFETDGGYYFYGLDGKARFAVAEGCQSFGLAAGEGRFVLGARAVETDGDPHYGRVTGITSYPNAPQLLNLPPPYQIPRIVGARAEVTGNVIRTVDGKRESKVDATDAVGIFGDLAVIKPKDGSRLDVMKIGSPAATIVTPPAGTVIREFDFDSPSKRIGWIEMKGDVCELVFSKFAETADKLEPKRLGAVPCDALAFGAEWALVGRVLVHIADGKRKASPTCEGPRCGDGIRALPSTTSFVAVVQAPLAIQLIPIASLSDPPANPQDTKDAKQK
jgi:hypothetical protein